MKKILVADDEELIRRLVSDFLVQEGYEPLLAVDGDEALAIFAETPDIALMILDIMMPGTDGWEVCRRVRETSQIPIICFLHEAPSLTSSPPLMQVLTTTLQSPAVPLFL